MLWILGAKGLVGKTLIQLTKMPFVATGREVDIREPSALLDFCKRHPQITHIINASAFSLVDAAEKQAEEAFAVNAVGPENLAKLAKKKGMFLLHISTDYVFSGENKTPYREEDHTSPLNIYGKTKREGEERVLRANPDACILRTSWIFGPGGKNFTAQLVDLLQKKEELFLDAEQSSKPTYVADLAEVLLAFLGKQGIYHFANEGATTKFLFAKEMQKEMKEIGMQAPAKIFPAERGRFPSAAARPKYSALDTKKMEKELSWNNRSWKEALKDYLLWKCQGP